MTRVVIFANGVLSDADKARALLETGDVIVCADGGTRHALALGLEPRVIVGDLDSIMKADYERIHAADVPIHQHPHDKDQTDLELALDHARTLKPERILIIGALGHRLDHTLGNISLLAAPELAGLDIRLDDGVEEVFLCRDQAEVHGARGDIVSLIPWGASVEGVRTEGLKWPLRSETLHASQTRGISNEMVEPAARVQISSGSLLIVHTRPA
jgi:thiamine pyrophosphokinase